MKRILLHAVVPAILPAVFFAVAATPVELIGCRNRGLAAGVIALMGGLGALGTVIAGILGKFRKDPNAQWWIISALILVIPAVYIVLIAY